MFDEVQAVYANRVASCAEKPQESTVLLERLGDAGPGWATFALFLIELGDEVSQGRTECFTHLPQLDQVQAAFAGLVLADEALRHVQGFGDVDLAEAGLFAQVPEQCGQAAVLRGIDRLVHGGESTDTSTRIPKSDIVIMFGSGYEGGAGMTGGEGFDGGEG